MDTFDEQYEKNYEYLKFLIRGRYLRKDRIEDLKRLLDEMVAEKISDRRSSR